MKATAVTKSLSPEACVCNNAAKAMPGPRRVFSAANCCRSTVIGVVPLPYYYKVCMYCTAAFPLAPVAFESYHITIQAYHIIQAPLLSIIPVSKALSDQT